MNLLREIYERLEFDRLISEGKDPVEVLHYKYQHVPSQIIDNIIKIDPTKKKSYSQWLLSKWNDESQTIVNNLRNGRIEKLFQHYKNHQDIQIKDCPSVEEGLRDFVPEEDTVLTKSTEPTTYVTNLGKEVDSELANDFDIVFNQDNWIIAVPNSYEAECKLGENMQWCTANCYGNGFEYYERYLKQGGKYYVNFDMSNGDSANGKDYPYTRYQFHFESKQLMDKNDDPIDVDYVGIPESALKFYESEGYDASYFANDEVRYEQYCEERRDDAYRLNDELCLMVPFDDNYEFNETDVYYVYDDNDERDPIDWTEIPNPHDNDVVIAEQPDYFILKTTSEKEYLLIMNTNSSHRDWEAHPLVKYVELPNANVVGIDRYGNVRAYSYYGEYKIKHVYIKNAITTEMFVNEACVDEKYDGYFVEIANSDGYHSLLHITDGDILWCVIKKDVPANGKYFEMDDKYLVTGKFRKYRVYDDDEYEEDATYINYDFENNLPNGDYLVSTIDSYNLKRYNILKRDTRQLLLPDWYRKFKMENELYVFTREGDADNDRIFFFNQDGQQIGDEYRQIGHIDTTHHILFGLNEGKCDLISGDEAKIILSCVGLGTREGVNNKVMVITDFTQNTNVPIVKCFDYVKREFCHEEVTGWRRIAKKDDIWLCSTLNSDGYIIFDLSTDKVITTGVTDIKNTNNDLPITYDHFIITKSDGKQNMLDIKNASMALPNDVTKIIGFTPYGIIGYTMGDSRTYIYNYNTKRMEINPNGIELPIEIYKSGDIIITSINSNYKLYFDRQGYNSRQNKPVEFSVWCDSKDYNNIFKLKNNLDKDTPQEVITSYNIITGQQINVTEQFRDMMRRINEATKLSRIDFIN